MPTLQVLAQCLHLVLGSLQQGSQTCSLFSGQEVTITIFDLCLVLKYVLQDFVRISFKFLAISIDPTKQYSQIQLNPNFAVFVTQTTEKYQVTALPAELRGLFRLVSVPQPHFSAALRSLCAVLGYKSGKMIADRIIMVHKLVTMQMFVYHNLSSTSGYRCLKSAGRALVAVERW